jgi:hypothetical protein
MTLGLTPRPKSPGPCTGPQGGTPIRLAEVDSALRPPRFGSALCLSGSAFRLFQRSTQIVLVRAYFGESVPAC